MSFATFDVDRGEHGKSRALQTFSSSRSANNQYEQCSKALEQQLAAAQKYQNIISRIVTNMTDVESEDRTMRAKLHHAIEQGQKAVDQIEQLHTKLSTIPAPSRINAREKKQRKMYEQRLLKEYYAANKRLKEIANQAADKLRAFTSYAEEQSNRKKSHYKLDRDMPYGFTDDEEEEVDSMDLGTASASSYSSSSSSSSLSSSYSNYSTSASASSASSMSHGIDIRDANGGVAGYQLQAQLEEADAVHQRELENTRRVLAEKNKLMQEIASETRSVNELFTDLQTLVDAQQPVIDDIEDSILISRSNAETGLQEVTRAEAYQITKRTRFCKCLLYLAVAIVIFIIFCYIVYGSSS